MEIVLNFLLNYITLAVAGVALNVRHVGIMRIRRQIPGGFGELRVGAAVAGETFGVGGFGLDAELFVHGAQVGRHRERGSRTEGEGEQGFEHVLLRIT